MDIAVYIGSPKLPAILLIYFIRIIVIKFNLFANSFAIIYISKHIKHSLLLFEIIPLFS